MRVARDRESAVAVDQSLGCELAPLSAQFLHERDVTDNAENEGQHAKCDQREAEAPRSSRRASQCPVNGGRTDQS